MVCVWFKGVLRVERSAAVGVVLKLALLPVCCVRRPAVMCERQSEDLKWTGVREEDCFQRLKGEWKVYSEIVSAAKSNRDRVVAHS